MVSETFLCNSKMAESFTADLKLSGDCQTGKPKKGRNVDGRDVDSFLYMRGLSADKALVSDRDYIAVGVVNEEDIFEEKKNVVIKVDDIPNFLATIIAHEQNILQEEPFQLHLRTQTKEDRSGYYLKGSLFEGMYLVDIRYRFKLDTFEWAWSPRGVALQVKELQKLLLAMSDAIVSCVAPQKPKISISILQELIEDVGEYAESRAETQEWHEISKKAPQAVSETLFNEDAFQTACMITIKNVDEMKKYMAEMRYYQAPILGYCLAKALVNNSLIARVGFK